jgi:hypothetical protein
MLTMDELLDMIIGDESPSSISDKIKDIIYSKSASRIENIRPSVSNSMFDHKEEEYDNSED